MTTSRAPHCASWATTICRVSAAPALKPRGVYRQQPSFDRPPRLVGAGLAVVGPCQKGRIARGTGGCGGAQAEPLSTLQGIDLDHLAERTLGLREHPRHDVAPGSGI